jgi:hypothetical protein
MHLLRPYPRPPFRYRRTRAAVLTVLGASVVAAVARR